MVAAALTSMPMTLVVAVFHDGVDLDLVVVTVVVEVGELLGPGPLAGEFGDDEAFEQWAEGGAGAAQGVGVEGEQACGYPGVGEDEFRCTGDAGAEVA
jgi:hypothetical protein